MVHVMSFECPKCGDTFNHLGTHWRYNETHRPEITETQSEVITGLMMGDGSLDRNRKNPILTVEMINKEYLQYLDNLFGSLSTGVRLKAKAEKVAERSKHSGFASSGCADNYSTKYRLRTRVHPDLSRWDWYTDSGKVWPNNIDLTPTVLKHWYAGDGSLNNNGSRFYLEIHCTNERTNKKKVEKYFSDIGICVDRWRDDERESGSYRTSVIFNKNSTLELLEYMGDPPPGFEYKWDRK
jgi:hypothetical protein